jgi:hypothetical protein
MLYLLIPGFIAIGLVSFNGWFVGIWLGKDFYAGDYISGLIALVLILRVSSGGLYKVSAVAGYRTPIGMIAIAGGAANVALSCWMGTWREMAGVVEASVLLYLAYIPIGVHLLTRSYGIRPAEYVIDCVLPWAFRAIPAGFLAVALSALLVDARVYVVAGAVALLGMVYLVSLRSLMARTPWPANIMRVLQRVRLVK